MSKVSKNCVSCGKPFLSRACANQESCSVPCGRKAAGLKVSGSRHPRWKGGRTIDRDGYVKIKVGKDHPMAQCNGYALEHRLIAAEKLGRSLTREEIAHHRDEIKDNNLDSNIEVVPNISLHMQLHYPASTDRRHKGDPNPSINCACGCGRPLEKYDKHGRARRFLPFHAGWQNLKVRRNGHIST